MNVVDSSGWLEYFADGPNAAYFAPAVENTATLVVPVISLILATAQAHDATLWTQDNDFKDVPEARYRPKV